VFQVSDVIAQRGIQLLCSGATQLNSWIIWAQSDSCLEFERTSASSTQNFTFRLGSPSHFSDGLTEAENSLGVSFGDERLPALIKENEFQTADHFASGLLDEVLHWSTKGSEPAQSDDITFVVIDLL
jgi:hypothetical protein